MPVTIRDVLGSRSEPKVVHPDDPLTEALNMMQRHDYSALPVIDHQTIVGILTVEGILKSSRSLGLLLGELTIRAAMDHKPRTLQLDEELPEVLRLLNDQPCVLITDVNGALKDIVTPWDTSEYYRQRAEDLMYIRDVEAALKEHIYSSFADAEGILDQYKLQQAIAVIASASDVSLTRKMLNKYFKGDENVPKKPNKDVLSSLEDELRDKVSGKELDDLSMDQLIKLLFFDNTWVIYRSTIKIPEDNIKNLLERIRQMRNDLAHFRRDELTSEEREDLRSCITLLQDSYPPSGWTLPPESSNDGDEIDDEIIPTDEEEVTSQGKYARLGIYLRELPMRTTELKFTFDEIEAQIDLELPSSARKHRSWWANDSVSHAHSQEWLDAGWRVSTVNMSEERVKFVRNKEREEMYIRFFAKLLDKLREKDFAMRDVNPNGRGWAYIKTLPQDTPGQHLLYVFSFSRSKQFRVELYIDTNDQDKNHMIFDSLRQNQKIIEDKIGTSLSWERLNDKRASRIAIYNDGHIEDPKPKLESLIDWAVGTMIKFESVMTPYAEPVLEDLS
jgi:CBS domain-containing protein